MRHADEGWRWELALIRQGFSCMTFADANETRDCVPSVHSDLFSIKSMSSKIRSSFLPVTFTLRKNFKLTYLFVYFNFSRMSWSQIILIFVFDVCGFQGTNDWRPPIFPDRLQPSIFGRPGLNHRVRDGNGCYPRTYWHQSKNFDLVNLDPLRSKIKQHTYPLLN